MPSEIRPARRRRLPLAALGLWAVLAVFGWGIVHLFELRFTGGDVYAPYSTLRRDPLGAAAFYDALAALPTLTVERNLHPLATLAQPTRLLGPFATPAVSSGDTPGALTCFYLGANVYQWPYTFRHAEAERLDAIMHEGGRLVLTFLPVQTPLTGSRLDKQRRDREDDEENKDGASDSPFKPKATPSPAAGTPPATATPKPSASPKRSTPSPDVSPIKRRTPPALRHDDLIDRWSIDFRRVEKAQDGKTSAADASGVGTAQPIAGGPLEGAGKVSWHSVTDFDLDTPEAKAAGWHALYQEGNRLVIVARPFGTKGGELILASDTYFLSNEALRAEGRPALLAGLVGPARRVVFDETHLGIAEQPGMMTLARRYHLQGGLAALGLLAVLFLWRNLVSLVPPTASGVDSSAAATTVTGRDAAAGFLNLLRRGVSPRDLIALCVEQWQHTPGLRQPDAATVERLRALAVEESARAAGRRSPATAYRAMCEALHRRKS